MPVILRSQGYAFYFFSHEPNEPPHVHVDKAGASAKVWLDEPAIARNRGYRTRELARILTLARENRTMLLEAWHGNFDTQG